MAHISVLGEAAVNALDVREDGIYVDATFGRGGHARRILSRLGPAGRLIALDVDPEAIAWGRQTFAGEPRIELLQRNFRELREVVRDHAPGGQVHGVLMDLGVSSPQLDEADRGFSFKSDAPLDMRMNPSEGESAADWLARVDEAQLIRVLREYGEERFAPRIARAIVRAREESPIRTTRQLAEIIASAIPAPARRTQRIHPATRSFQAIRIAVNDELGALDEALEAAVDALAPGGRLVVISFHSLEDRRVKQSINKHARSAPGSRRLPVPSPGMRRLKAVGGLVRPDPAEVAANPRARSARMRIAERLPAPDVEAGR
ncbi:MAG: 16S rRNA (cytosine(1402)-N(4))-methyltransferase RsmH [Wenzhouxiangellaceae bacterium]